MLKRSMLFLLVMSVTSSNLNFIAREAKNKADYSYIIDYQKRGSNAGDLVAVRDEYGNKINIKIIIEYYD